MVNRRRRLFTFVTSTLSSSQSCDRIFQLRRVFYLSTFSYLCLVRADLMALFSVEIIKGFVEAGSELSSVKRYSFRAFGFPDDVSRLK